MQNVKTCETALINSIKTLKSLPLSQSDSPSLSPSPFHPSSSPSPVSLSLSLTSNYLFYFIFCILIKNLFFFFSFHRSLRNAMVRDTTKLLYNQKNWWKIAYMSLWDVYAFIEKYLENAHDTEKRYKIFRAWFVLFKKWNETVFKLHSFNRVRTNFILHRYSWFMQSLCMHCIFSRWN